MSNASDFIIESGVLTEYTGPGGDVVIPDGVIAIEGCYNVSPFYRCESLTSVIIPDSVTKIGYRAFSGCESLTSIAIPDSVTEIGYCAFSNCKNLTSVNIPDGVTQIGDHAFSDCESLTSIAIPDSVTQIGDYAFSGCKNLASAIIPDSVAEIGDNAFSGCSKMADENGFVIVRNVLYNYYGDCSAVVIPEYVTEIGYRAFSDCKNLTSINIPDSVTQIGDNAFSGCESLTSIVIPNGVTSISAYTFYGCEKLTSITIPDSVTHIAAAFRGCRSLTNIIIPKNVRELGNGAFMECHNLKSITILGAAIKCTEYGRWDIVDYDEDVLVSVIGTLEPSTEEILSKTKGIKRIFAPNTPISIIGDKKKAVRGYLNDPDAYDPDVAEGYCKYITGQAKWTLPEIFKQDRAEVLEAFVTYKKIKADNIDQMYLEPAMEEKAQQCVAFLLNWKKMNVTSEQEEKLLERELTKDPYNEEDMKKLWSYKKLEDGTLCLTKYKGTDSRVVIPERIGENMVSELSDLFAPRTDFGGKKKDAAVLNAVSSVVIPDTITKLQSHTFRGCQGLADQDGFIIVRDILFDYIGKKTKIKIPEGVTAIDRAFSGNGRLQEVEIPETVIEIRDRAFCDCRKLKNMILHTGLKRIGIKPFDFCLSLTSIILPDGVTEIGKDAFAYCEKLASVTIPQSVTAIGQGAFKACPALTIHAPAGSYAETYAKEHNIPFVAE